MKAVVVGNCQARPLATYLTELIPTLEITATPIVHLLKDKDEPDYASAFEEADVIITQNIADKYPCKFVRTCELRARYPGKVFTILNLYFSGYTPDLMYIRHPSEGTLKGPLGDYHNLTILKGWLLGIDQSQVVQWLEDEFYNSREYGDEQQASLAELKRREAKVDVPIADFIEENWKAARMFFTFNHPTAALLYEYAVRICRDVFNENIYASLPEKPHEPLDLLIPVPPPGLGLTLPTQKKSKGQKLLAIDGAKIQLGGACEYSNSELVAYFYEIYDKNADFLKDKYREL
ncbi:WcbI family polysaccharide biosynthesis putative acetyltransferase [Alteromonas sp. ASW11-19]|uniref:WcbI family polysaccharide biosynthesis putative acetyltransferase n=1 Tax=Alteromonas salexigens TaxID=2982530 RepID=A0ABT2VMB2_9ALTE|nr:WcbI family polysaccharide biosynthesis putative acetyltransferase [Alteromonas salexigens]MCU7554452.1 WcbI family polysaccharide biosynthesis putative acetyltransferase [Alteromonas salexigens]